MGGRSQPCGTPERFHVRGNAATVSYNVTGSNMRINLGAAFSELFKGEEGGINVASLRPVTVYTPYSVKNHL
jgi:hypothetical protein